MRRHWKAFVIVAVLSFIAGTIVGGGVWTSLWNKIVTFDPAAKMPPYRSASPDLPNVRPPDTDNSGQRQ
jgi:hypothetical protein